MILFQPPPRPLKNGYFFLWIFIKANLFFIIVMFRLKLLRCTNILMFRHIFFSQFHDNILNLYILRNCELRTSSFIWHEPPTTFFFAPFPEKRYKKACIADISITSQYRDQPVSLHVHFLFMYLPAYLFVWMSFRLTVHLSVHPTVYTSVCLPFCFFISYCIKTNSAF